jgi:hypothetical protein
MRERCRVTKAAVLHLRQRRTDRAWNGQRSTRDEYLHNGSFHIIFNSADSSPSPYVQVVTFAFASAKYCLDISKAYTGCVSIETDPTRFAPNLLT